MKVLIALDDDEASQDALLFAEKILPTDADVIVLNVARFAWSPATWGDPMVGTPVTTTDDMTELQDDMDERAHELTERAALVIGHAESAVAHGDPGHVVVELAEAEDVDLIIVGTHDKGLWTRLWFGSVSHHVVTHAPCSVLVVR